jgi:proteasome-associated ATPase
MPFLREQLTTFGEHAPTVEEKSSLLQAIRNYSKEAGCQTDRFLIERLTQLHKGLSEARDNQEKLKAVLDKLTAPPWHLAIFLGFVPIGDGNSAAVMFGNSRRVVSIGEDVDLYSLAVGDEVLLSNELNTVVDRLPYRLSQGGEVAVFDRLTPDNRMVLKWRDDEVIVDGAESHRRAELKSGDYVRWDRSMWLAFEKVERSKGADLFLEETPSETFEEIGGLDRQIETLRRSILLHLNHSEIARKYRLRRKGSALLLGPPGTGKTMMARALANWLAKTSRTGRSRFMNVKPASLHSMWYSQSEANYREVFRVARQAGDEEPEVPVVIFFDEVDAIGASRGASLREVDDRVLTAFMTELDGLESRGNILVVAATNRLDVLDPALLRPGRLGDNVIEVPRPGAIAAREIFARHLRADIPYAENGYNGQERHEIIEAIVSRIYSPNADNDLAIITLRDGRRRMIKASDLMSGAGIAKIALAAVERACMREVESGEAGVKLEDLLASLAEEFESSARALTSANCRNYISDLPQDVDVVRVEAVKRKVSRSQRYLSVA